ncbi:hypothetical protein [Nitrososphaera sp.]|uniref:hypothetical protein n=1 Tax=Nitrososphaera sp. TaxID=1971748 RepID=UPI00182EFA38|nr:hypothetical protein [Nitrososphaera sp.]NWG36323.1 hypothetical protein [Nitrososphaera sp.]
MDRLGRLIQSAQEHLEKGSLWRAYVAVESAILDVKMRHALELEEPPAPPKRNAKKDDLLADARSRLSRLDVSGDKKKLLYDLRACRDALKAALAKS